MNARKLAEEARKIAAAFEVADGPVVASLDASILSSISAIPAALIAQADLLDKYRYQRDLSCPDHPAFCRCTDAIVGRLEIIDEAYDAMIED